MFYLGDSIENNLKYEVQLAVKNKKSCTFFALGALPFLAPAARLVVELQTKGNNQTLAQNL
jgi:hypothetical protein